MRRRGFRGSMVAGAVALAVVAALVLARAGAPPSVLDGPAVGPSPPPAAAEGPVPVARVVDGDTIRVLRDAEEERVRLLGIDAPEVDWYGERAECFGDEAGRFLRRLLAGERVLLEQDREPVDRYGRTLAYVYLEDGPLVNLLLVREGYAVVRIFPPNDRYEEELRAAEDEARGAARGLWEACV